MPTLDVFDLSKKKVGKISLDDQVFGVKVNHPLVHQVLKAQRANARQGTAKTKTRAEVRGGGRKPYRQKGTGNARRGSQRSPIIVGGGQNFGPQPRSYARTITKGMQKGALRSVLSDRVRAERIMVLDQINLDQPKTKTMALTLRKGFDISNVLIIDAKNENLELACRNIPKVKVLRTEQLNVYDLLSHDWLLVSKKSVQAIQDRLAARTG